jgi:hypothetical protein
MLKSLLHIAGFHQQSTMEPSLMNRNEFLLNSSRRDMPREDALLAEMQAAPEAFISLSSIPTLHFHKAITVNSFTVSNISFYKKSFH